MPANHSNTNRVITILIHSAKTHFSKYFCCVAKDMTLSLISSCLKQSTHMEKIILQIYESMRCHIGEILSVSEKTFSVHGYRY